MGPRKKSKPNSKVKGQARSSATDQTSKKSDREAPEGLTTSKVEENEGQNCDFEPEVVSVSESKKTWYGGTWPRTPKATPVTQVAKESISAAGAAASEVISSAQRRVSPQRSIVIRKPSSYLAKGLGGSSRSLPLAATTTKLHITSSYSECGSRKPGAVRETPGFSEEPSDALDVEKRKESKLAPEHEDINGGKEAESVSTSAELLDVEDKSPSGQKKTDASSGWTGRFFRSSNNRVSMKLDSAVQGEQAVQDPSLNQRSVIKEPVKSDPAEATSVDNVLHQDKDSPESNISDGKTKSSDPQSGSSTSEQGLAPRSWLGLWSYAAPSTEKESQTAIKPINSSEGPLKATKTVKDDSDRDDTASLARHMREQPAEVGKSYGWAFWTREPTTVDKTRLRRTSVGELTLVGSPSPLNPENVMIEEPKALNRAEGRETPRPSEPDDVAVRMTDDKKAEEKSLKSKTGASFRKTEESERSLAIPKQEATNLLLPPLRQTYSTVERPGVLQQIGRLLQYRQNPPNIRYVSLQNPPRIKRALAIGVHGYFPAPLIRSVLGQPTGTSIRFANGAADAIQRWTAEQGYSCEVEKVALEGEGKISERLELLWKLLLNWLEDIRKADFVMIACHSQGVPVAIMLISKLISFGCLSGARIGICAMAGINLGPFGDYKSRWISGTAGELFEFARPDSRVSRDYEAALDVVLKFGARITYIGSIDDQLVSIDSSTFGPLRHPYIYRAVFIDGRVHASDFLSHLVGLVLKLRNLGLTDHGLIRELSTPLAGSLYGGEGHSRIYEDESVYTLAVQFALETTSLGELSPVIIRDGPVNPQNPYILPFAMRGILEEEYVRTELHGETRELLRQFDDWKPSSKVLKDVKFRLEGVRSKL